MTRVATTNYSAVVDTRFEWATSDNDIFDRELDLYRLAQALEHHTHNNSPDGNRGLAVTRLGNNVVTNANMQALSIATGNIQDSAVTNVKLASTAVTRDKIVWPLVQLSNDMAGGFRQRDTTNTYAVGFYMATNGLAVFGSGTVATINPNLILGQTGQVSVGATQGSAFFNIMQTANSQTGGARIYNTATTSYTSFYNGSTGEGRMTYIDIDTFYIGPGRVCVGHNAFNFTGKLNVQQTAGTFAASEGLYITAVPGIFAAWIDTNGDAILQTNMTPIRLETGFASLSPHSAGGVSLGRSGLAWGAVHCGVITAPQITATAGTLTVSAGNVVLNGVLSGMTGLVLSGHTTMGADATYDLASPVARVRNAYFSAVFGGTLTAAGSCIPQDNGVQPLGGVSNQWSAVWASNVWISMSGSGAHNLQLGSDSAGKPSTNTWTVVSDSRTKIQESIQDYREGLEKLLNLRPIFYRYNGLANTPAPDDQEEDSIGFIAEEAQTVAPELVKILPTRLQDTDDDDDLPDVYHVNTHPLPFMMINAFKTWEERWAALTKRLDRLEGR